MTDRSQRPPLWREMAGRAQEGVRTWMRTRDQARERFTSAAPWTPAPPPTPVPPPAPEPPPVTGPGPAEPPTAMIAVKDLAPLFDRLADAERRAIDAELRLAREQAVRENLQAQIGDAVRVMRAQHLIPDDAPEWDALSSSDPTAALVRLVALLREREVHDRLRSERDELRVRLEQLSAQVARSRPGAEPDDLPLDELDRVEQAAISVRDLDRSAGPDGPDLPTALLGVADALTRSLLPWRRRR